MRIHGGNIRDQGGQPLGNAIAEIFDKSRVKTIRIAIKQRLDIFRGRRSWCLGLSGQRQLQTCAENVCRRQPQHFAPRIRRAGQISGFLGKGSKRLPARGPAGCKVERLPLQINGCSKVAALGVETGIVVGDRQ